MSLDCSLTRTLLPEYGAGALDGRDRAAVEAHINMCADCRAEADAFVEIADSVLSLAPSAEPRIGFEAAVMERIGAATPRRGPRAAVRILAAAAAVLAVGLGLGRMSAPSEIQTAALRAKGNYVGKAWVHRGDPGWIYVDMRYSDPDPVSVEVVDRAGAVTRVGQLVLRGGHGTLGVRSPVPVSIVRSIRMREANGTLVCHAELS